MIVIGLGKNLLLKSVLGHCDIVAQITVHQVKNNAKNKEKIRQETAALKESPFLP